MKICEAKANGARRRLGRGLAPASYMGALLAVSILAGCGAAPASAEDLAEDQAGTAESGHVTAERSASTLRVAHSERGAEVGTVAAAATKGETEPQAAEGEAAALSVGEEPATETNPTTVGHPASGVAAAAVPNSPEPGEQPQPSPWRPNGSNEASERDLTPEDSPQPSPWDGHIPGPTGPNSGPHQDPTTNPIGTLVAE